MRWCNRCKQNRPLSDFMPYKGKYHAYCRPCFRAYKRVWMSKYRLRGGPGGVSLKPYGLTLAAYEEMEARQGGGCAICKKPRGERRLHVDHDHVTGRVRALLCSQCNHGLGCFNDNPEFLRSAGAYLDKHHQQRAELSETRSSAA